MSFKERITKSISLMWLEMKTINIVQCRSYMSNMSALILGISMVLFGYFIGNGISRGLIFFKSNDSKYILDKFSLKFPINDEDILNKRLVKKKYIARKLGVSIKEVDYLINRYPQIRCVEINGKIYYDRESLTEWIENIFK